MIFVQLIMMMKIILKNINITNDCKFSNIISNEIIQSDLNISINLILLHDNNIKF